jgi:DNA-binding beta-propeller fold protein YncE
VSISVAVARATPELQPKLVLWGFSSGVTFSQPCGVAIDPTDGAIYVANTGQHRIEIFSAAGRPLAQLVHRVTQRDGKVVDGLPCALVFDRSGHLLVVDQLAPYVDVLDLAGRSVARLDAAGSPTAVAVSDNGTIYVGTNADSSAVLAFGADYEARGAWGQAGTAPGYLKDVAELAALGDTAIAVVCLHTDETVQVFTPSGQYLHGFGSHEIGDGNFSLPSGMVATADGRIWVLDEIRRSLQVFDAQGNFLEQASGDGTALGELTHPSALTSDGRGLLALTDSEFGRVQVFGIKDGREETGSKLK